MKMVPYDPKNVPNRMCYKTTKILGYLEEFQSSGVTCVKIEDHPYKNAKSCAAAFKNAAKHFGMGNIDVITRMGETFLIRKDLNGSTQTLAYRDEDGNWKLSETPDYRRELLYTREEP